MLVVMSSPAVTPRAGEKEWGQREKMEKMNFEEQKWEKESSWGNKGWMGVTSVRSSLVLDLILSLLCQITRTMLLIAHAALCHF